MRVLLLREGSHENDRYEATLQTFDRIRSVHSIAPLSTTYDLDFLRDALCKHAEYSKVIITSQRSVQAINRALQPNALHPSWLRLKWYVVGHQTRNELVKSLTFLGQCHEDDLDISGEESGSASKLSAVLETECTEADRVLLLGGDKRRPELIEMLTRRNIPFDAKVVYNTTVCPAIHSAIASLQERYPDGKWNVVFFSPSGIDAALSHVQDKLNVCAYACIGKTTATALMESRVDNNKIPVVVAEKPTPESLLDAISTLFNQEHL